MAKEISKRDDNRIPVVLVVTDDSNLDPTMLRVDPSTLRLKVTSIITGNVGIAPLTTVYNGTKTAPTVTAEAIASSQAISSVTVKALSTNTVAVYVGATGVTTANGFELLASESISLDIDNLADVFVISGSAAQVVKYVGI